MSGSESPISIIKLHQVGARWLGEGLEGGLAFATSRSLGSFGRVLRLCGLATVVPGLPGALEGLRPLLVHDHVVHTLIWRRHASSITLQLRDKNLLLAFTDEKSSDSESRRGPTFRGGVDLPGSRSRSRYSTCLSPFGFTIGLLPPSAVMGAPSFMFYVKGSSFREGGHWSSRTL